MSGLPRPGGASALSAIALTTALLGCGGHASMVRAAPGFEKGRHEIAVFGVYRDGRLDEQSWDEVALPAMRALGAGDCEPGYGPALRTSDPDLFAKLDEESKDDGITPDELEQVVGSTSADLIAVIYVSGHARSGSAPSQKSRAPARGMANGGRRAQARAQSVGIWEPSKPKSSFEIAASLYSVRAKAFVAEIEVPDPGSSTAEGADNLGKSLSSLIAGSICVPWIYRAPPAQQPPP